jgi:hypothetical protein
MNAMDVVIASQRMYAVVTLVLLALIVATVLSVDSVNSVCNVHRAITAHAMTDRKEMELVNVRKTFQFVVSLFRSVL